MDRKIEKQIADKWDHTLKRKQRVNWWQSKQIIRHVNFRICGEELSEWNAGGIKYLREKYKSISFQKGISIGCGVGTKEMSLIQEGIVEHFLCYDLSKKRIENGREIAFKNGLSEKISFCIGDFYESADNQPEQYDFVYWDNSLHHMLNTKEAIKNSYNILIPGGVFYSNDFVGATRFQWSDLELAIINGVRVSLPEKVFETSDGKKIPRIVKRHSVDWMIKRDPSEAADSENILPSVRSIFPNATIVCTGGSIYHVCLDEILQNIPENSEILGQCLRIDDEVVSHGITQYAFMLAKK